MRSLYFILISTFFMGITTGAYIYFVSRSTNPVFNFGGSNTARGFEITGDMYGGCQRAGTCVSYRIDDTGSLVAVRLNRNGENTRYEEMLSSNSFSSLKDDLRAASLSAVADSEFTGTCPADYDGNAYRYEIQVGEDRYLIDSCKNDLVGESLFDTLEKYFDVAAQ